MIVTYLAARLAFVVPLLLSTVSLILCALCVSAGHSEGFFGKLCDCEGKHRYCLIDRKYSTAELAEYVHNRSSAAGFRWQPC